VLSILGFFILWWRKRDKDSSSTNKPTKTHKSLQLFVSKTSMPPPQSQDSSSWYYVFLCLFAHFLVSPVSFMQMLPKPIASKRSQGKFADSHPLLVVCADGSLPIGCNIQDGSATSCNGSISNDHDPVNVSFLPTAVRFYSLRSESYVYVLKFRSVVYSVRCSSRVVAISLDTFESIQAEPRKSLEVRNKKRNSEGRKTMVSKKR
jgi:hypothetical protein